MGNSASIVNSGGIVTVSGLTDMAPAAVGGMMSIYNAASPGNNGSFPVASYISSSSVTITNGASPLGADANNGSIGWSLDWDKTAFIGPIDKKITSATDLATPDTNHGLYATSSTNPATRTPQDDDRSTFPILGGNNGGIAFPTPPIPAPINYQMRSHWTIGGYFFWVNTTGDDSGDPGFGGSQTSYVIVSSWET
jgi:hypothetical protein